MRCCIYKRKGVEDLLKTVTTTFVLSYMPNNWNLDLDPDLFEIHISTIMSKQIYSSVEQTLLHNTQYRLTKTH